MKAAALAALVFVFAEGPASAQATAGAPPVMAPAPQPAAMPATDKGWSSSASAYTYVLPDSASYVQPAIAADRGRLHLEGRFNYEDLDTGSAWFGYNVTAGETVALEITPMFGAVFGRTAGVAPGFRASLDWRKIEFSTETEYVFDAGDSAGNFLYTWSELGMAPVDWCRFGVVVQRTKAYKTDFDIQRGFFVGASYRRVDVTAYVFNPDARRPTVVVGVGVRF